MEETMTVQQLGQALNQLLDAYEDLQNKNTDLKKELEDAQLENEELKEQVNLLSSTTTEQNSEMDAMINRIESILGGQALAIKDEEKTVNHEDSSEETQDLSNEDTSFEQEQPEQNEEKEQKQSSSNDQPDLGRMQALLNGFNS